MQLFPWQSIYHIACAHINILALELAVCCAPIVAVVSTGSQCEQPHTHWRPGLALI